MSNIPTSDMHVSRTEELLGLLAPPILVARSSRCFSLTGLVRPTLGIRGSKFTLVNDLKYITVSHAPTVHVDRLDRYKDEPQVVLDTSHEPAD